MNQTITEQEIKTFLKTLDERKRSICEQMGQEFTEQIYNECDPFLQDAIWKIVRSLDTIPEPIAAKRGKRPLMNIQTMQIWLNVHLLRFKHSGLPIQSSTGESALNILSPKTLPLGIKNICWTEENWKRELKNANRLIKKYDGLNKATSLITENIKLKKTIEQLKRPDRIEYLKNQRKMLRRKLRKKAQPLLNEIQDTEIKLILQDHIENWFNKNINAEYEKIRIQLKDI